MRTPAAFQKLCPLVLSRGDAGDHPDLAKRGVATKIVDVPMRRARPTAVVTDPRGQAAGAQGAANIGVEAWLQLERPQSADPHVLRAERLENQHVGPGKAGVHGRASPGRAVLRPLCSIVDAT